TSLALSVRTGDTPTPDASWTAFIPLTGPGVEFNGAGRYLQYRAVLATTAPALTPALRDVTFEYTTSLLQLDGEAVTPASDVQPLTQEGLAPFVSKATALWLAAGADAAALGGLDVRIADLP